MKKLNYSSFISCFLIVTLSISLTTYAQPQIIFSEGWESGWGSWWADNGVWGVGIPTAGPGAAHSGANCAGTVLDGNYPVNANTRLISPSINLPTLSGNEKLQLKFWHWFRTENENDQGVIQISVNSGAWQTISTPDFDGYSVLWTQYIADLSMYAGSSIRFAFYFTSNGYAEDNGWYIDDITIEKELVTFFNPEDFELGIGNWFADNGLWEIGEPTWGPSSAHSGQNCAGTVLTGNYPVNANTRLISPAITLIPKPGENPMLFFFYWNRVTGGDTAFVQLSVNGGEWQIISSPITGNNQSWSQYIIDLSAYNGATVRIAFYFTSNDYAEDNGWYIDDIRIEGIQADDNQLPVIDSFTADPSSGSPPAIVDFNCQAHDPDGSIIEYRWDFNGDGSNDDTTANGLNSYTYNAVGIYHAQCTVVDSVGATCSDTLFVIIYPAAARLVSIPDTSIGINDIINIPVQISDPMGIAGAEFTVNFNPGILLAQSVQTTSLTSGFTLIDSINNTIGRIACILANESSIQTSNPGSLVGITFQVKSSVNIGDTCSLVLANVMLSDESSNTINSNISNGLFTVIATPELVRIELSSTSDTLLVNDNLTIYATGYDAFNNIMPVYPDWRITGNIGTINPLAGDSTVFTATHHGSGQVIASQETFADSVSILVCKKGNLFNSADTTIDVRDAIFCLRIIAELINASPIQMRIADMNEDQTVDANDALLILYESIKRLMSAKIAMLAKDTQKGDAKVHITNKNNQIIPITISDRTDICAASLTLLYDSSEVEVIDVTPGISNAYIVSNTNIAGKVKVALIHPDGLINKFNELIKIQVRSKKGKTSELTLEQINLYDASAYAIEIENITNINEQYLQIPYKFSLHQNYPNPFNPTTTIRYDLAEASFVKIEIYNILGIKVRTLINTSDEAGTHTKIWDAKNDQGIKVSTGVYIYRIRAISKSQKSFVGIKKMLLLK
jgi:PKD repeat protein